MSAQLPALAGLTVRACSTSLRPGVRHGTGAGWLYMTSRQSNKTFKIYAKTQRDVDFVAAVNVKNMMTEKDKTL